MKMKSVCMFVMLVVMTACELQPAPKESPPPPPVVAPTAAVVAPSPGVGSAAVVAAPPPIAVSAECEQAGVRVAELMINGAEPSQKPSIERERANLVRRTEEACARQSWTAPAIACIGQAKSDADAHACLEKFPPPGASAGSVTVHPVGKGSGAGKGPKEHPPALRE